MYISKNEFSKLDYCVDLLQKVLDDLLTTQNNIFPEGLNSVKVSIEEARKASSKVLEREASAMAIKIARNKMRSGTIDLVKTQFFNGEKWIDTGDEWPSVTLAWAQLGRDNFNHRVVDKQGNVLKENTNFNKK